ncbi:MAG: CinA family protein, partial [Oscillospiraceae bacterium]
TGLAGPDGDGVNPIGTVYVALATENEVFVKKISSGFSRSRVRTMAASCALDMVRRYLTKLPVVSDYQKH